MGTVILDGGLAGNPVAPTQSAGDNDTSIATTAFVTSAVTIAAKTDGRDRLAWTQGQNRTSRVTVMTTPPTITFGASGSYAAAPANAHAFINPVINADGRTVRLTDNAGSNNLGTVDVLVHRTRPWTYTNLSTLFFDSVLGSATTQTSAPCQWSYQHGYHGSRFAWYFRNVGGGKVRIKVDGQYVSMTPTSLPGSWSGLMLIDFGRTLADGVTTSGSATVTSASAAFTAADKGQPISGNGIPANAVISTVNSTTSVTISANATATATGVSVYVAKVAPRDIEIECWLCAPAQLITEPTGSAYLPERARGLRIYLLSDSFGYGTAADEPGFTSFVETIRERTGIEDIIVDAVGSTGWLRTAGAGGNDFLTRLQVHSAVLADADLVLFTGSVNDSIYTAAQVQAQATACLNLLGSKPAAAVVFTSQSPVPAGQTAVLTGIQAAFAASSNGLGVLDLTTILTGIGYAANKTGVGNSDWLRGADGTHPSQFGHDVIGRRIASWLPSILPGLLRDY